MRTIRIEEYDAVYAIVRSMKRKMDGVEQIAELSPSWELFKKYMDLRNAGNWNEEMFRVQYVPQFIEEMKSEVARKALNRVWLESKRGKSIALVCFCDDEMLCHRSIVAGLLQGVGVEVRTEHGDYSKYYSIYKG